MKGRGGPLRPHTRWGWGEEDQPVSRLCLARNTHLSDAFLRARTASPYFVFGKAERKDPGDSTGRAMQRQLGLSPWANPALTLGLKSKHILQVGF